MLKFDGWMLPDGEAHLQDWMTKRNQRVDGRLTYQYHKYEAALKFCRNRRVACDVGAHVGLMSLWMARDFQILHAFEPMAAHRECWMRNMGGSFKGFTDGEQFIFATHFDTHQCEGALHACALGAAPGMVALDTPPGSSGGAHISGPGDIEMRTLDSFEFEDVDFIKIDCEGYELAVLEGATETLKRCRPCVIVEQKPHTPGGLRHIAPGDSRIPAVDYLRSLGAFMRTAISGDFVMSWDPA